MVGEQHWQKLTAPGRALCKGGDEELFLGVIKYRGQFHLQIY